MIDVGERETRIAVLEDGKLAELHVEREERVVGNVYKARVDTIRPGMDAAFVDIGLGRNAFLYVGDVLPAHTSSSEPAAQDDDDDDDNDADAKGRDGQGRNSKLLRRGSRRRQRINEVLKVGQDILVQVTKGPRGTKGARVSTLISLPGHYLVLMPDADNVGVSRKITEGAERDRLKKIGERMREPGYGIIIRTEAEDKPEADLVADKEFLKNLWLQITGHAAKTRAPALIHQDFTLIYQTLRDIFGSDVSRLVINDPVEYAKAHDLLGMVSPKLRGRLQLYSDETPIFDQFGVEPEIEKSLRRKVWLKSGGYLIIDETEALTVIDVNSGKFTGGHSLGETILRTNMDAAAEIARQMRIRDIGGIIVIDFIDMNNARDKQQVIKTLETALSRDRSRTKISNISPLGLVEMTRKRTAETFAGFMTDACPHCQGRGKVSSPETVSIQVEQALRQAVRTAKAGKEAFLVECSPEVAEMLIGELGSNVDRLESELRAAVYIRGKHDLHVETHTITPGTISDFDRRLAGPRRGQVLEVTITQSALEPAPACVGWADGLLVALDETTRTNQPKLRVRIESVRRSFAEGVPMSSRG